MEGYKFFLEYKTQKRVLTTEADGNCRDKANIIQWNDPTATTNQAIMPPGWGHNGYINCTHLATVQLANSQLMLKVIF